MAINELQTRIALKYDSYANWTDVSKEGQGGNLVLLAGEIGICELPTVQDGVSNVAPTVLFKVGGATYPDTEANQSAGIVGKLMAFKDLPWASAKAADVYSWAKAKTVAFDTTNGKISFKNEAGIEVHSVDLSTLATKAVTEELEARLAAVESSFEAGGSVAGQIAALDTRLDVIEGEASVEGSIKKAAADALASAQEYADQAEEDAVDTAKAYTDEEVGKDRERLTALETADGNQDALIAANTAAITKEAEDRAAAISAIDTDYKAADKAINDKIGGAYTSEATVHAAIVDAKDTATAAGTAVTTLAEGAVATNTQAIADLNADLTAEIAARTNADSALDARLGAVEAFFEGAAKDEGEGESLKNALDTLVEIQTYIDGDGNAADEMIKDIAANAKAIDELEKTVNGIEGTNGLVDRMGDAEANIASATSDITNLKSVTAGYTEANAIQTAITAAQTQADKGVNDAKTAKDAADAAQSDVDALTEIVNSTESGLAATKKIADDATAAITALDTRVETAENDIEALDAIVITGDDANSKLRSDITSLQTLTGDASKGNEKLRSDLDTLTAVVENETTGLAATKAIADSAKTAAETNAADIATIMADYLKAADQYIFNCGNATSVDHTIA